MDLVLRYVGFAGSYGYQFIFGQPESIAQTVRLAVVTIGKYIFAET